MKKIGRLILAIFVLCMFSLSSEAQTKTKTTTKKTTTRKAPKPISVFVCVDEKDKLYHKRTSCAMLHKCKTEIKNVKSVAELKKYRRKSCLRCYNS